MIRQAVVIGSGGQVARAIITSLRQRGSEILISSSSGKANSLPLDLANEESIRAFFQSVAKKFPSGQVEVFLPGAMTHVDRCEAERELCRKVNLDGPALVARECAARGYGLTHFSTEYVFGAAEYEGGAVGPFSEEDEPAPPCWYGETKLLAERAVLEAIPNALVIRTTMIFSWDETCMNFLMQYFRQFEKIAKGEEPPIFRVPEDQISTPTYAPALAEATCTLREKGVGGIINLVGSDLLSRRELVQRVAAAFQFNGVEKGFRFLRTSELGQPAKRPLTAGLRSDKARALGLPVCSLDEAFRDIRRLQGVR